MLQALKLLLLEVSEGGVPKMLLQEHAKDAAATLEPTSSLRRCMKAGLKGTYFTSTCTVQELVVPQLRC